MKVAEKCSIVLAVTDDWQGLYIDGKVRVENHILKAHDVVPVIVSTLNEGLRKQLVYSRVEVDQEIVENEFGGNFPVKLEDLTKHLEEE